ncbi:MAG: ABC transporter ATP-binding protein [Bacteroidales bacterium]|nr:ABC transporter ATP-binding protein [Bacteroidales bacterium]
MIDIQHISAAYQGKTVLHDVNFTVEKADFLAIMGRNGSGKSTLLRTLTALQPLTSGNILIDKRNLKDYNNLDLAKKIAYVPQRLDVVFDFSVREMVMMGRNPYQNRWGFASDKDCEIVDNVLEITHLTNLQNRFLGQLSGGELRRSMIALAIAQQTPIILLDEPLANLDVIHQFEIMDILTELNHNQKVTIIMILHEFPFAIQYAQKVLLLKEGNLLSYGRTDEVLDYKNIKDCFSLDDNYLYQKDGCLMKIRNLALRK